MVVMMTPVGAFTPGAVPPAVGWNRRMMVVVTTQVRQQAGNQDESASFSEQEVATMDDLILSLSLEQEDSLRRDKVAQVLGAKLLEPNGLGSSDRFVQLFEDRLTCIGNDVRDKAAKETDQGPSSEAVGKQLWALVDMMIQSKVIFKPKVIM